MKTIFKASDRIFHISYKWGTITDITKTVIKIKFDKFINYSSIEFNINDIHLLSFTEYTLEGFSQERPWEPEIPEIGEWAFFWDDDSTGAVWRTYKGKQSNGFLAEKGFSYENVSKTPPPHLGGK